MRYKQVKYFRRTPNEIKVFNNVVDYYISMGYPRYESETRAWDAIFYDRKARKNKTHLEVF